MIRAGGSLPEPVTPQGVDEARQLGRYEVIAGIASGGMGTVVLARLAGAGGFQRLFAVKLLHEHAVADPEFVRMFLDEARIAAKIHHPNVVGIQEIAEDPQRGFYLVMDYVEGWPLSSLLEVLSQPEPARWRVAHRVLLDALTGLDAAHHLRDEATSQPLRVVHRDFSPHNVLVGVDGIARVTDFGVAKAAARISSTRAGQVKGKLSYMAPEQARAGSVDARTDVFAAGIMLWEALTSERLFKRPSAAETGAAVLNAPIPSPRARVPDVPEALADVAMKALARDPAQRYASARTMAEALEEAARATGLLASGHEVGGWLRATFGPQIAARREAIRAAMQETSGVDAIAAPGGLRVPQLPRDALGRDRQADASRTESTGPTASGLPSHRAPKAVGAIEGPASDGETPISDARIVATLLSGRAGPSEHPAPIDPPPDEAEEEELRDEGATELDSAARVAAMLREMGQLKAGIKGPIAPPRSTNAPRPRAETPRAAPTTGTPVAPATFKLLSAQPAPAAPVEDVPDMAAPPDPLPSDPTELAPRPDVSRAAQWDEGLVTTVFDDGAPRPEPGTLPPRMIAFDDEQSTNVYNQDAHGRVDKTLPPAPRVLPAARVSPPPPGAPLKTRISGSTTVPRGTGHRPSALRRTLVAIAWVLSVVACGTALGLAIRWYLDHRAASTATP